MAATTFYLVIMIMVYSSCIPPHGETLKEERCLFTTVFSDILTEY